MFTSALSTDCPGLWQMIAGFYYGYGYYSWQLLYISSQGYNDMARCSTYCDRVHSHEYEATRGLDILMPVETQHPHQFHLYTSKSNEKILLAFLNFCFVSLSEASKNLKTIFFCF